MEGRAFHVPPSPDIQVADRGPSQPEGWIVSRNIHLWDARFGAVRIPLEPCERCPFAGCYPQSYADAGTWHLEDYHFPTQGPPSGGGRHDVPFRL